METPPPIQGPVDPDGWDPAERLWDDEALREPCSQFQAMRFVCSQQATHCFWVPGRPGPAGSKTFMPSRYKDGSIVTKAMASGKPMVIGNYVDCGGKKTSDWRHNVAIFGRMVHGATDLLEGPLGCMIVFYQCRPQDHFRSGRFAGQLKPKAPDLPTGKPDIVKLARSTEDALTGIVWKDDKFVVTEYLAKRFGPEPGARIIVWPYG